jgi:rod shape-determining protein MreC
LKQWKPGAPLSSKRLWLRKIRASFRLYRRLVFVFLFIVFSATLIVLSQNNSPLLQKVRTGILFGMRPLIGAVQAPFEWMNDGKETVASWTSLHKQNERLETENARLRAALLDFEVLQAENIQLKQLLNVKQREKLPLVTAKVLAQPGRPYLKSLLIAAGENHGIRPQQVAVHEKGLVGRVIHVAKNLAYILLLTDANSHVPVVIRDKSEKGILIGMNDAPPFIKYMPSKNLQVGDVVETSGHGGIFPPGIPVGHITKIEDQIILVEPFCDTDYLPFVMLTGPVLNDSIQTLVDHETFDPA